MIPRDLPAALSLGFDGFDGSCGRAIPRLSVAGQSLEWEPESSRTGTSPIRSRERRRTPRNPDPRITATRLPPWAAHSFTQHLDRRTGSALRTRESAAFGRVWLCFPNLQQLSQCPQLGPKIRQLIACVWDRSDSPIEIQERIETALAARTRLAQSTVLGSFHNSR